MRRASEGRRGVGCSDAVFQVLERQRRRRLSGRLAAYPLPTMSSVPLSLDEEVRLYTTNAEREKYGLLSTLFGIIVALEYLERAYVRDSVTAAE